MTKRKNSTVNAPALPGLVDVELVGLKDACGICGVGHSAKRLDALGIRPVNEVRTGRLTFRAYRLSDCVAYVREREAAEAQRLAAMRAKKVVEIRTQITAGTKPISERQSFAVLCEIRTLLKQLVTKQTAEDAHA